MDSEKKNEETGDSSAQSQQSSEQSPASKLRDLRPEKDPMGAAGKTTAQDSPAI